MKAMRESPTWKPCCPKGEGKASKDEPYYTVESAKSGKQAAHKESALSKKCSHHSTAMPRTAIGPVPSGNDSSMCEV